MASRKNRFYPQNLLFNTWLSWLYLTAIVISLECDDAVIKIPGQVVSGAKTLLGQFSSRYITNRSVTTGRNVAVAYDLANNQKMISSINGQGTKPTAFAIAPGFFIGGINPDPSTYMLIPFVAEALVVVFNLPGVSVLYLSMDTVAKIYLGEIRSWNHSEIQAQNPSTHFPSELIRVVARQDSAGTTDIFTRGLSNGNAKWAAINGEFQDPSFTEGICCNSTNYPNNSITYWGYQGIGMAGIVASFQYSLGYLELTDAVTYNLSYAFLKNAQGVYVNASPTSIRSAVNYWTNQHPNDTNFDLLNANVKDAYPLTTFISVLLNLKTLTNFSCCVQQELTGFIYYITVTIVDNDVSALQLITVPDFLSQTIQNVLLPSITCGGNSVFNQYLQTLASYGSLQAWAIAVIAIAAVGLTGIAIALFLVRWQRSMLEQQNWLIPAKSVNMQSILATQSLTSMDHSTSSKSTITPSTKDNSSTKNAFNKIQFPMAQTSFEDRLVFLQDMNLRPPSSWKGSTRTLSYRLCLRVSHPSLLSWFGVTVLGMRVYAVQEHCVKGTLHYVLSSSRFEFSETIKLSMAMDVAEGMSYLHSKGLVHGQLNSINCYVANSWVVKVSNWMLDAIASKEDPYYIADLATVDKDDLKSTIKLIGLIYISPSCVKTRRFTIAADLFSYGMLLVELINRKLPYAAEVANKKTTYNKILRNKLQFEAATNPEILSDHPSPILERISRSCLVEEYFSFDAVIHELKMDAKLESGGGVTDILMDTMEKMIVDLEKKTLDLNKITARMKEVINEVLPPAIAEDFIAGKAVAPEYFESASVFFSDIVGFTTLASKSTPMEVMGFLNDLWVAFDCVIEMFDCYKVDTIGDAYMVCSGLPTRNGLMHVKHIADLAIALLERTSMFTIRHMPGETLQIRIGLNSGPVTAGVVGTKLPQYCVFGDTVNTASRMESSSLPGRIQASEATAKLLTNSFPRYKLERRGEIDVKGKGRMSTYWLEPPTNVRTVKIAAAVIESVVDANVPGQSDLMAETAS